MSIIAVNGSSYSYTTNEHNNHELNPHTPIVQGIIDSGTEKVFIAGKNVLTKGDSTKEECSCCGGVRNGVISSGHARVFIKGKQVAYIGSNITTHDGKITNIQNNGSARSVIISG